MRIKERKTSKNKNPNHEKRNEGKYKQRQKPLEEKKTRKLKKSAKSNHPNVAKECCLPLGLELSSSVGWLGPKTRRKLNNE